MKPLYWDAINPFTGQPFTFDDPNVFWDFYLEPGDPGFTPYATPVPEKKTKKGPRMKRNAYYPSRTAEQIVWLENFRNKLAQYQAALGLTALATATAVADARWLIYVLGSWLPAVRAYAPACTAAAEEAQTGTGAAAAAQVLPPFIVPDLPAAVGGDPAVVPVLPGALDRLFKLVALIKDAPGFTDTIGEDLGVIGSQQTGADLATIQPKLTLKLQGNTVFIGWGWQGHGNELDQIEIQVDRGAGWTMLTFDTTPDYIDTTPFPATATRWKYRAIYRVADAQVGLWSEVKEIIVGG